MTLFIKVVSVPGPVTEVALEPGSTVTDALSAANVSTGANHTVSVNGDPSDGDRALSDGDRVIVSLAAKSA